MAGKPRQGKKVSKGGSGKWWAVVVGVVAVAWGVNRVRTTQHMWCCGCITFPQPLHKERKPVDKVVIVHNCGADADCSAMLACRIGTR